jgi:hypothetical protein
MPSRLDHPIDKLHRSRKAAYRPQPASAEPSVRKEVPRYHQLMLALALGLAASAGVQAGETMPKGMKGWWYYISALKSGYVSTPQEACALSATNHWGAKLKYIKPADVPQQGYECYYANPVGGRVFHYSMTRLYCERGYVPAAPGVCVKWREAPRPPSCSPGEPGYAVGNPVAIASGAKIQTETDLPGSPDGTLRITRTYRTLRMGGNGQSGGQGWSFSFDRHFALVHSLVHPSAPPVEVNGTFGDGAYFAFDRRESGRSAMSTTMTRRRATPREIWRARKMPSAK